MITISIPQLFPIFIRAILSFSFYSQVFLHYLFTQGSRHIFGMRLKRA